MVKKEQAALELETKINAIFANHNIFLSSSMRNDLIEVLLGKPQALDLNRLRLPNQHQIAQLAKYDEAPRDYDPQY